MTLTTKAKQQLELRMRQLFAEKIDAKQYLNYVKNIYINDCRKQKQFFMDQGFSEHGAIKHVYNLDYGIDII